MATELATLHLAPDFDDHLSRSALAPLSRAEVTTLQVQVGRRCDLACLHCHVEAGPLRTEMMDRRTADRVLELMGANPGVRTLDLTGGAPELNDQFRHLVRGARRLGRDVIDRCNLTVLLVPGQEDTAHFLAEHRVRVIASLPCYTAERVDAQRGRSVFDRSIAALQQLGELGYGRPGGDLGLDLVFNPADDSLPPPQAELETRYRETLRAQYGIEFDRLLTITNMPIKRFARQLARDGREADYLSLLVNHFNPDTVSELMCRSLVSIDHTGQMFDCDFNQMLELPIAGTPRSIWDDADLASLSGQRIATARHCFGCTAGAGSSCGGTLT